MEYAFILIAALVLALVVVHFVEWRMYSNMRRERDLLRENLVAMTVDRDGWRSVGQRALLVAQLGTRVTNRAARLATSVPEDRRS